jgi:DCC1-like thiol-disulfide oxidoreductase
VSSHLNADARPNSCRQKDAFISGADHEMGHFIDQRSDRMRRRLPPIARSSVMSAAILGTHSKATTIPVVPAVPRVFAFSMQAEQSIVVDQKSPGGINSPHGLILFDGVCVLCSRGCRFVSKRDRCGYFRFVPIQLAEGRTVIICRTIVSSIGLS